MSKAVYAKIWMSTRNFQARRRYGWFQVCSRLSPWLVVWGIFGITVIFPALNKEHKKMLTLGIWRETDVGYNRSAPQPYE